MSDELDKLREEFMDIGGEALDEDEGKLEYEASGCKWVALGKISDLALLKFVGGSLLALIAFLKQKSVSDLGVVFSGRGIAAYTIVYVSFDWSGDEDAEFAQLVDVQA